MIFKNQAVWIKGGREDTGLSIRAAAKIAGISAMYLYELESGKKITLTPTLIFKLAHALKVMPRDLLLSGLRDYEEKIIKRYNDALRCAGLTDRDFLRDKEGAN